MKNPSTAAKTGSFAVYSHTDATRAYKIDQIVDGVTV